MKGRPDLEIRALDRLVWIEVKVEAELQVGQLEGYRVLLGEYADRQTRLILLTRYLPVFQPGDACPDREVRWFELADRATKELATVKQFSEAAEFLARQFVEFLEARRMTLTQVGKYMPDGIRALTHLLNMLFEVGGACRVSVQKAATWSEIGVHLDGRKYWIGVRYTHPEQLVFATRGQIDMEAAHKLGVGELTEENAVPGRFRWQRSADLDSESVHFFERTKLSQLQWLLDFLRECLSAARSIEIPDQPPIPVDPEST